MKKKNVILTVVAIVAVALVAVGLFALYRFTREDPQVGGKNITVTVTHKDGTKNAFKYSTDAQYLGALLVEKGLIQGDDGPYGLMIHTVDGEKADWDVDQSYWAVYEGEAYATTGIDQIVITDGAAYGLVYTIG